MLLLGAGFIIFNFLGYQALAQRRTAALSQQGAIKLDIIRLQELQNIKPAVDVNSEWINAHLPAYTNTNQFETHLFNIVNNKAIAAGVELSKKDPRPTQKEALVHKSILEVETTANVENLVDFLHALQGREDFRFVSFLELTPTKDEERVRCQARIEQWWRADSEELAGIISSDVPRLPSLPLTEAPSPAGSADPAAPAAPEAPAASALGEINLSATGDSEPATGTLSIEQPAAGEVQLPPADPAALQPPQ